MIKALLSEIIFKTAEIMAIVPNRRFPKPSLLSQILKKLRCTNREWIFTCPRAANAPISWKHKTKHLLNRIPNLIIDSFYCQLRSAVLSAFFGPTICERCYISRQFIPCFGSSFLSKLSEMHKNRNSTENVP